MQPSSIMAVLENHPNIHPLWKHLKEKSDISPLLFSPINQWKTGFSSGNYIVNPQEFVLSIDEIKSVFFNWSSKAALSNKIDLNSLHDKPEELNKYEDFILGIYYPVVKNTLPRTKNYELALPAFIVIGEQKGYSLYDLVFSFLQSNSANLSATIILLKKIIKYFNPSKIALTTCRESIPIKAALKGDSLLGADFLSIPRSGATKDLASYKLFFAKAAHCLNLGEKEAFLNCLTLYFAQFLNSMPKEEHFFDEHVSYVEALINAIAVLPSK